MGTPRSILVELQSSFGWLFHPGNLAGVQDSIHTGTIAGQVECQCRWKFLVIIEPDRDAVGPGHIIDERTALKLLECADQIAQLFPVLLNNDLLSVIAVFDEAVFGEAHVLGRLYRYDELALRPCGIALHDERIPVIAQDRYGSGGAIDWIDPLAQTPSRRCGE